MTTEKARRTVQRCAGGGLMLVDAGPQVVALLGHRLVAEKIVGVARRF